MKEIRKYQASDGTVFDTEKDALYYEASTEFEEWINQIDFENITCAEITNLISTNLQSINEWCRLMQDNG